MFPQVQVRGLQGLKYLEQLSGNVLEETSETRKFPEETDSVYYACPNAVSVDGVCS